MALAVLFSVTAAPGAQAQPYTVTNLTDSGVSGDGSLRGEVLAANAHPGADTINFAGGLSGTIIFAGAGIVISGPLDIEGPGPGAVTVAQTAAHRVFEIEAIEGKAVTIAGLRIADGTAPSGGANPEVGGDILNGGSTLTLADDVITGGSARVGGGVASTSEDAPLVLRNSTVAANQAEFDGGIDAGGLAGTWTIQSSTITANGAEVNGGLDGETHGTGLLEDSTISGNHAEVAAGASLEAFGGGQIAVRDSTVAENTATLYAGGLDIEVSKTASVNIEDTTISANRAVGKTGEEEFAGGIAYNGELGLTLDNTIVTGNKSGEKAGEDIYGEEGTVSTAFSVIGKASVGFLAETVPGSDLIGVDPGLGPLAANGGPTQTMALAATSPAVNRGSSALASDQRGLPRPVAYPGVADPSVPGADGADIGAFELQAPAPPVSPSNSFSFGKVRLNRKKGTATVQVKVPDAGEVIVAATRRVKKDGEVAQANATLELTIRSRGRALKSLRKKGKVKVMAEFTFTPSGGTAASRSKTVKLIKR